MQIARTCVSNADADWNRRPTRSADGVDSSSVEVVEVLEVLVASKLLRTAPATLYLRHKRGSAARLLDGHSCPFFVIFLRLFRCFLRLDARNPDSGPNTVSRNGFHAA